jgi:hypothetical protein
VSNISADSEKKNYFEALEDIDIPSLHTPPIAPHITPPNINYSANMKFSQEDINELSAKLAPILIKDLKSALKEEVLKEIRHEIREIVHKEFRDEISKLKAEINYLQSEVKSAHAKHDDLEQYGRRMCLDISGIPGDSGKPDENVEKKLLDQAKKVGLALNESDIDKCHCKGKPVDNFNRKVIVKFTNSKARQRVYSARKRLGDGIFVQENLTPYCEYLGYEARKLKRAGLVTKTWVAGCKIYAQVTGKKTGRQIMNMDDINAIIDK